MLTRRHHLPRPRRGFSLVEILVVITIIGVLTAITAGAMFRLKASQTTSNTEGTLSKIDRSVMLRWGAVLEQAKRTVPVSLVDRCGDKDRALALWTYATLKNEFPMTFLEAKATVNLGAGASLSPRKYFVNVANGPALASLDEESAALLYAGVNQSGNAGNAAGTDGLNQQIGNTKPDGSGAAVYKDGWGGHIFFLRHASGGEINNPPYSRPNAITVSVPVAPSGTVQKQLNVVNILDPRGLISDWGAVGTNPWLNQTTMDGSSTNADYLKREFERGLTNIPAPSSIPLRFRYQPLKSAENVIPTLVSSGANKMPGVDYLDPAPAAPNDQSADNLLSYRLRREGDKGN